MVVVDIIGEPLLVHGMRDRAERRKRVTELLELVRLPAAYLHRYPARVQRRPAAAHRHRPRARAQPRAGRRRRAGLGARRVGAGADPQPAAGSAGRAAADLPVRRARPERGEAHQRPRRGHVCRPHRRTGGDRGAVRAPAAPLHRGAALRRADAGAGRRQHAHHPGARDRRPRQSAARLRLPSALPPRHRPLPAGGARRSRKSSRAAGWPACGRANSPCAASVPRRWWRRNDG